MKFLIQTINGIIEHDFSFHLIKSIDYQNWFYNRTEHHYILSDSIEINHKKTIPIGSIEFVQNYLNKFHPIVKLSPINVPEELSKELYLKRKIWRQSKENAIINKKYFIKSDTKYKSFQTITDNINTIPQDRLFISELIDIESEWRVFVYQNKMVGLQNYLGDFTLFPDIEVIENMIKDYKNSPIAYTLDLGVNQKDGTFIIESHPFISCGLYGFSEYKYLPQMMGQTFKELIT